MAGVFPGWAPSSTKSGTVVVIGGLARRNVATQPPLSNWSQLPSPLRATTLTSWPVTVPPMTGKVMLGPARKLASTVTRGGCTVVAAGCGAVGVGTRIGPVLVVVVVVVTSVVSVTGVLGVTVSVAVIGAVAVMGVVVVIAFSARKVVINSSVARGAWPCTLSTRIAASHKPLLSRYQVSSALRATIVTVCPAVVVPTASKVVSGPERRLAVIATVPVMATVGPAAGVVMLSVSVTATPVVIAVPVVTSAVSVSAGAAVTGVSGVITTSANGS